MVLGLSPRLELFRRWLQRSAILAFFVVGSFSLFAQSTSHSGVQTIEATRHNHQGIEFAKRGDHPAAIKEFREALALDPQSATALYNLGVSLDQTGQPTEAIAAFRSAVKLNPSSGAMQLALGRALLQTNHTDAAGIELERAVRFAPTSADAHYALGMFRGQRGDLTGAVAEFLVNLEPEPTPCR